MQVPPGRKGLLSSQGQGEGVEHGDTASSAATSAAPGNSLMLTQDPVAICTNFGTDSEDCLAYVGGETVTPTTTLTTAPPTFTEAPIVITPRDVMLYFTVYGVGGAHIRRFETVAWAAKTDQDGPNTAGYYWYQGSSLYKQPYNNADMWAYFVLPSDATDVNKTSLLAYDAVGNTLDLGFVQMVPNTNPKTGNASDLTAVYELNGTAGPYRFAVADGKAQTAPVFIGWQSKWTQADAAVIYPVGATKGSCGIYYRYRPAEAPENLFSYTYHHIIDDVGRRP